MSIHSTVILTGTLALVVKQKDNLGIKLMQETDDTVTYTVEDVNNYDEEQNRKSKQFYTNVFYHSM